MPRPGDNTAAFVDAAHHAGGMLADHAVEDSWSAPSVLAEMTVGAVAGHIFLVLRRALQHLDDPQPDPSDVAPQPRRWTWSRVDSEADLQRLEHLQVRLDGEKVSRWGWAAVVGGYRQRLQEFESRVEMSEPSAVLVGGLHLSFEHYMATRVVEMLVHADDLGSSAAIQASTPPPASMDVALPLLFSDARSLYGDVAMMRALARRERAPGTISVF
jgi:hypothetical protein